MDEQEKVMKFKEELLNTGLFKRTSSSSGQYVCQECPFCGDRKKHMYVLIDLNSTAPVYFHCFKCLKSGVINREFLEYFGIDNLAIPRSSFRKKIELSRATTDVRLDSFLNEEDDISGVCNYIHDRVGQYPSLEELQKFQYIGKPVAYYNDYIRQEGQQYANPNKFKNRYWFRLTNGSMIGRYLNDETNSRWLKFMVKYTNASGLYVIKQPFDSHKTVNVYVTEGIMDTIGLYYNYPCDNSLYIAVLGRDYGLALRYLISVGIFGKSVNVKIFKDSDVKYVKLDPVYVSLFGKTHVYRNMAAKDYGVKPDLLDIQKCINE